MERRLIFKNEAQCHPPNRKIEAQCFLMSPLSKYWWQVVVNYVIVDVHKRINAIIFYGLSEPWLPQQSYFLFALSQLNSLLRGRRSMQKNIYEKRNKKKKEFLLHSLNRAISKKRPPFNEATVFTGSKRFFQF